MYANVGIFFGFIDAANNTQWIVGTADLASLLCFVCVCVCVFAIQNTFTFAICCLRSNLTESVNLNISKFKQNKIANWMVGKLNQELSISIWLRIEKRTFFSIYFIFGFYRRHLLNSFIHRTFDGIYRQNAERSKWRHSWFIHFEHFANSIFDDIHITYHQFFFSSLTQASYTVRINERSTYELCRRTWPTETAIISYTFASSSLFEHNHSCLPSPFHHRTI